MDYIVSLYLILEKHEVPCDLKTPKEEWIHKMQAKCPRCVLRSKVPEVFQGTKFQSTIIPSLHEVLCCICYQQPFAKTPTELPNSLPTNPFATLTDNANI